ncbi:hypothetical protein [Streptomyces europaeiscabiei]|uniref:FG-GAP repeat domain-containing protein n=1 Tax=Streptomyces europaeiscabiei TaxID=146819 RepID=UPI002E280E07|nr:hypothetical protein [Streptomyces europaeiscabiei]
MRLLTNGEIQVPGSPANRIQTFAMYSRDDGQTWINRTDITSQVNPRQANQPAGEQQGMRFLQPGPGHGIQLRPGGAKGTLWWWQGDGIGGLAAAAQQLASGTSFAAYSRFFTGDVNSDGHTDFAAVNSSTGAARWWAGDGAGHVSTTASTLTVLFPVAATTPALLKEGVCTF